jgi:hypothetical protein
MHLALYKALIGVNIPEEQATQLVEAMDAHIAQRISDAIVPLTSKIDHNQGVLLAEIGKVASVKKELDADKERRAQLVRWVIVTAISAAGLTLGILKGFGLLH